MGASPSVEPHAARAGQHTPAATVVSAYCMIAAAPLPRTAGLEACQDHDMHPARLFIVCGLPGAGKTTRAVELAERFAAVRMSSDDWMERLDVDIWDDVVRARVERLQHGLVGGLLRVGTSVVVERGTRARRERDELRAVAEDVGAFAHLEFLDPPLDVLWDRVSARERERSPGSRAITRADLEAWSETWERPTPDETGTFDPTPPVRAGDRPGGPAYPYGGWRP